MDEHKNFIDFHLNCTMLDLSNNFIGDKRQREIGLPINLNNNPNSYFTISTFNNTKKISSREP